MVSESLSEVDPCSGTHCECLPESLRCDADYRNTSAQFPCNRSSQQHEHSRSLRGLRSIMLSMISSRLPRTSLFSEFTPTWAMKLPLSLSYLHRVQCPLTSGHSSTTRSTSVKLNRFAVSRMLCGWRSRRVCHTQSFWRRQFSMVDR